MRQRRRWNTKSGMINWLQATATRRGRERPTPRWKHPRTNVLTDPFNSVEGSLHFSALILIYLYLNIYNYRSIYIYICVYLSLYLSIFLSISISVSISISFYMHRCVYLVIHLYICMRPSFSISINVSIYLYIHLYTFMCQSIYRYIYLPMSIYVSINVWIFFYLSVSMCPSLSVWLWRKPQAGQGSAPVGEHPALASFPRPPVSQASHPLHTYALLHHVMFTHPVAISAALAPSTCLWPLWREIYRISSLSPSPSFSLDVKYTSAIYTNF